jgi:methionyl-tRNA formyltransferase
LYKGKILKIYKAAVLGDIPFPDGFGEVVETNKKEEIWVRTPKGILNLLEMQPEGKRKMSAAEFARGYRIKAGEKLG